MPKIKNQAVTLDELDRRILNQLQSNSRLSNAELAKRVHTSAPTCLRRVRRLYETGVITKEVALINPELLGPMVTAICEINLENQSDEALSDFEEHVTQSPKVLQCYRVSPGPDFVLIAQLSDMSGYRELAKQLFASNHNIRSVRTFFSVHCSKFETAIPV